MKTDKSSKAPAANSDGDKAAAGKGKAKGGKAEPPVLAIGAKVLTTADPKPGQEQANNEPGVIVDDFAATLVDGADFGRDWALARRWAIQLDNGRLVFRSSDELTAAS